MNNLRFVYLYRDGSNYKQWANVVFSNPENLTHNDVERLLRDHFLEDGLFIADQLRMPEAFLWDKGDINFDDHCFHEFSNVELTKEQPNDTHDRSISDFLREVSLTSVRGWRAFEPSDRRS
jgi:hypothetical protein